MTYKIKPNYGHFVVYIDGRFFCTADNEKEAEEEIEEYAKERGLLNEIESS